jgi:plastocyanin
MRRWTIMVSAALGAMFVGMLAGPAMAGAGCHGGATDGHGATVSMLENCFAPAVLHVSPGQEVGWTNDDPVAHTVTGVASTWGTYDELLPGEGATYGFEEDGVYLYSCILHPGMVGAVVVGDGSGDAGLDPAAVATVPTSAEPSTADAPVTATVATEGDGTPWLGIGIGALSGIGLATLAMTGAYRKRDRRRLAASA